MQLKLHHPKHITKGLYQMMGNTTEALQSAATLDNDLKEAFRYSILKVFDVGQRLIFLARQ